MAQHDMVIDNGPGLAVRTDMNAAIQALATMSSGPIEPTVKYPGQFWLDTTVLPDGQIRQRNLSNTAWTSPAIDPPGADLKYFMRTGPDRWVWNDKADGTGTDVARMSEVGRLMAQGFGTNLVYDLTVPTWRTINAGYGGNISFDTTAGYWYFGATTTSLAANGAATLTYPLTLEPAGNANIAKGLFANGGSKHADTTGAYTFKTQPATLAIDYAGPGTDYGAVFANRSTGGGASHCMFLWVSTLCGSIVSTSGLTTAYNTTSDINTKANVRQAENSRAIIDALQVVEYTPLAREGDKLPEYVVQGDVQPPAEIPAYVSIPAQQAYSVYPQAVTPPDTAMPDYRADATFGDEGFVPWMIDHSKFVPILIGNMQEANARIDALEARIAALEAAAAPGGQPGTG